MEQTSATGRSLLNVSPLCRGVGRGSTPTCLNDASPEHHCRVLSQHNNAGYKRMADYKDAIKKLIGLHVSAAIATPPNVSHQPGTLRGAAAAAAAAATYWGIATTKLYQYCRCLLMSLCSKSRCALPPCVPILQALFVFIKVAWSFAVFQVGGKARQCTDSSRPGCKRPEDEQSHPQYALDLEAVVQGA